MNGFEGGWILSLNSHLRAVLCGFERVDMSAKSLVPFGTEGT